MESLSIKQKILSQQEIKNILMILKNARTDALELGYRNKAKAKISIAKFTDLGSSSDILRIFQNTPEFIGLEISTQSENKQDYIEIDGGKIIDSYYRLVGPYGTMEREIGDEIPNFIDYSSADSLPFLHKNLLEMLGLYIKISTTVRDKTRESVQRIIERYQIPLAVTQIIPKILIRLAGGSQKYILESGDFPSEEMDGEKLAAYLELIPVIAGKYKMTYRESNGIQYIEFTLRN